MNNIKVRVMPGRQVVHDGRHYLGGEVLEVPDHIGVQWTRFRWVEMVEHRLTRRRRTPRPTGPGVADQEFAREG